MAALAKTNLIASDPYQRNRPKIKNAQNNVPEKFDILFELRNIANKNERDQTIGMTSFTSIKFTKLKPTTDYKFQVRTVLLSRLNQKNVHVSDWSDLVFIRTDPMPKEANLPHKPPAPS